MANKINRETFVIEQHESNGRYYVWGYDHEAMTRTLYSTNSRTMEEAEAEKALLEAGQHSTQTEPGGTFGVGLTSPAGTATGRAQEDRMKTLQERIDDLLVLAADSRPAEAQAFLLALIVEQLARIADALEAQEERAQAEAERQEMIELYREG